VNRKWRYGMEQKGKDCINLVPLVDSRKVAPPPELLSEKHFNDWTLAYTEYENSLRVWRRLRRLVSFE
jgi:hypothetical protein